MRRILAADFGGTRLRAAVVEGEGLITHRNDTESPNHPDGAGEIILQLLRQTVAEAGGTLDACCIASAGLVDAARGRIVISPNIPGFRNLGLVDLVEEALGLPVYLENDASAWGLAEWRYGAGHGFDHLLHVAAGTGIGGGLVLGGRLYRGARGFAGEIGHMVLDDKGPVCGCGSRGCLEALVSGTAFEWRAKRLIASGRSPLLAEIAAGETAGGEHLLEAAKRGDIASEAEIRNAGHYLGLGLGSLMNILNPQAITMSGGLLGMGEMLFASAREALKEMAYGPTSGVEIRLSELGDDGGLLGAAAVALEHLDS